MKYLLLFTLCSIVSVANADLKDASFADIQKFCLISRSDKRLGHALMIGFDSNDKALIIENSPIYDQTYFGAEKIDKRLNEFFNPRNCYLKTSWLLCHTKDSKFNFAGFCYQNLTEVEKKRALKYFKPDLKISPFSNFSHNCTHFVSKVFKWITGNDLYSRGFAGFFIPNPNPLTANLKDKAHTFQKLERVKNLLNKMDILEELKKHGILTHSIEAGASSNKSKLSEN